MVDAVQSFGGSSAKATPIARTGSAGGLHAAVTGATPVALATYRSLAQDGLSAPAQSAAWVETWIDMVTPDTIVATLSRGDEAVLALALEVVRKGPFRIARFMGATHANGNFPAARRAWLAVVTAADVNMLIDAIGKARPDVDMVALERLLPQLDGLANPLNHLRSFKSANLSLAVDLYGGFDALLARSSGKRKRKKYRSQSRKFEAAGGHRRIEASTPDEVDRLLDAFFAMKEVRFRKAGISNVFGEADVQAFFRQMFTDALTVTPLPYVLHALDVGGTLRAITGSSRRGDTLICEFGAIVEDELAHASPGDFLFFENIRDACAGGFAVYDFSVGDELYKRLWCDMESQHMDAVAALSIKGRVLAQGLRLFARSKAFIKNSPTIWKITKALRRRAAAPASAAAESSDD